jgi:hypothetical protein
MLSIQPLLFSLYASSSSLHTEEVLKLPEQKSVVFKYFKNTDLYQTGMVLGIKLEMY